MPSPTQSELRAGYESLPPAQWTEAEAMHHLTGTFDRICRMWPDIMEPYIVELAETVEAGRKELLRRALRETVLRRYSSTHEVQHHA